VSVDSAVGPSSAARGAKTLLLTILGEAVLPSGPTVWQEVLVRGLTVTGVSVAAARQAVARAIAEGWLSSERIGRRSLLTIADSTAVMLREGRDRTMRFGQPQEWDGRWLLVLLTVPEESRALRYQFRTQLAWLGFGSLGNGLWISPHTENEAETVRLLATAEGPSQAFVFTSARPASHSPRDIASVAWDSGALLRRYSAFLDRFERARPTKPEEYFAAWIELVTAWRHFPLFDPELPSSLLPPDWPRRRAYAVFHAAMEAWAPPSLEFLSDADLVDA
jgi:phenylacetic acid degradation operon negative regulatory protein